jgi:ribosomal protein S12 methylthiotransferase
MAQVLLEAESLVKSGVKELILVAQNTTAYGLDIGQGYGLEHLLQGLADISGLGWVRVLYGHPDYMTDSLVEVVASHGQLCPYFDIPIQHISPPILKRMGRRDSSEAIFDLFERIRDKIPDVALRTTLMVGFPGESDHDFECLLDLVERVRFDHLGAFVYSDEKDLPSRALRNHVPDAAKQERFEHLMSRQLEISKEDKVKYVGKTVQVLVEGSAEGSGTSLIGRTRFQAPEIDGSVYINKGVAEPGIFVDVQITEASEYDLTGVVV